MAASSSSTSSVSLTKSRVVYRKTVEKWITENDRTLNTLVWLKFEADRHGHVLSLKCSVCSQFKDKLVGMRNYQAAFVDGTTNVRISTVKDHGATEMHAHAMLLFRKKSGSHVTEYSSIAAAFHRSMMDPTVVEALKKKFEIAYTIAKENFAFLKMEPLCSIEEKHGVKLGEGYRNDQACVEFVHFIAQDLQNQLIKALTTANFFSLQADSSTDAGELLPLCYCIKLFYTTK